MTNELILLTIVALLCIVLGFMIISYLIKELESRIELVERIIKRFNP